MLVSDNLLDNVSLFATAHMCVGIDSSEISTSLLYSSYGKAVSEDCSHARLVPGTCKKHHSLHVH